MGKALVIVESPSKAKTINKYLGKEYIVKSSVGHIRDLPKSGGGVKAPPKGGAKVKKTPAQKAAQAKKALIRRMGVNPEKNWEANYEVLPDKQKVLKELKDLAAKADTIYLATDLDREGEAIAWHLREAIGGDTDRYQRVTFSEITKNAIQEAFQQTGAINQDRVDAQQARRFLDRVVGYMVSPLLWKKVARGLSAGRVQSVATRLVVEREREIAAFIPDEYWEIHAQVEGAAKQPFIAEVVKQDGAKLAITNQPDAEAAVAEIEQASLAVQAIEKRPQTNKPNPPFITSTLQQAASVRLGFGVKKTMTLAQRLYEAGHITYMRTDSTALSNEAVTACRTWIGKNLGDAYLPKEPIRYGSAASAQEAHEAIRPTDVRSEAEDLKGLEPDQARLYDLIRRQFIACQMPPARYETTAVTIAAGRFELRARGRVMLFDGWTKILPIARRKGEDDRLLPSITEGETLALLGLEPSQHFTKPPARFSEASLVKELEKRGIGRPSTYAATIATIQDRGYVRMAGKRLFAEKMGEIVTDRLVNNFDELLDYGFTASMEQDLDKVAAGDADWQQVLDDFYANFKQTLAEADEKMRPNEPTEVAISCPACGRNMQVRTAKTGVFLSCSGYALPKKERCTETINLVPGTEAEEVDGDDEAASAHAEVNALRARKRCDICGSAMDSWLVDEQRKLHVCARNPDCPGYAVEEGKFKIKGYDGPVIECDKCGSDMQLRSGRFGKYFGCTNKECKNTRKLLRNGEAAPPKADPIPMPELPCEKSDSHFVLRDGAAGIFLASSIYPRSRETRNPLVKEILPHADELDPKFAYLVQAPAADPDGNPSIIRFSRKSKQQYVSTEKDGKAISWSAWYENGAWVEKQPEAAAKKAPAKKATAKKAKAPKKADK